MHLLIATSFQTKITFMGFHFLYLSNKNFDNWQNKNHICIVHVFVATSCTSMFPAHTLDDLFGNSTKTRESGGKLYSLHICTILVGYCNWLRIDMITMLPTTYLFIRFLDLKIYISERLSCFTAVFNRQHQ